jgi:nucleoporin NUP82
MARVVGHTPSWLSPPSPGFNLFQRNPDTKPPSALRNQLVKAEARGPTRTIAHRGTEIFVLVGNEIRWSDLVSLKDAEQDANSQSYRLLKTPVASQIKQLVVSPHGDYLAILTEHTVHIAVLPDSSHLSVQDASPLRIKTFQLGPTAHVL